MDNNQIAGENNPPGRLQPKTTLFDQRGVCPSCYDNGGARLTETEVEGVLKYGLPFIPEPCKACGKEADVS